MYHILAILIGFILDTVFGDPHHLPHPVRAMGKMISYLENFFRKLAGNNKNKLRRYGYYLVAISIAVCILLYTGILYMAYHICSILGIVIESVMIFQLIAPHSLCKESMRVYESLKKDDIKGARYAVSMIVGRDTKNLDAKGIIKATVETVAENLSDGVVAVLFYILFFTPFGAVYKVINTMDSILGYKDEKYIDIGKAAAKLDDAVNLIPARISAVCIIISTFILESIERLREKKRIYHFKNSIYIFKRDRFCHASPNSAQSESACAGALGIELAGDAYYFGKLYKKPTIGDALRDVEMEDILRINILMYLSSVLFLLWILIILCILYGMNILFGISIGL